MLRRLIRGFVRAPLVSALLGVVLLGGGALALFQSGGLQVPSAGLALPGSHRPPPSVETYFKGHQTFNAELIWDSLSDEAIERWRSRGGTPRDTQQQLDQARQRGATIEQVTYVGGYPLPDGTSLQFYVAASHGPSRSDPEHVTYIFTLDRAGKITRVQ